MKKIIFVIAMTFAAACIFSQKSVKVFDPGKLSNEELLDIKKFNEKKGQPRWEEFQKIEHIFPTCEATVDSSRKKLSYKEETVSLIMTKDQLEKLIGKPDFENGSYELGKKRFDCEVSFPCNEKNEVLDFVFANCSGQLRQK